MDGAAGDNICVVNNIPPEISKESLETAISYFGEVIDSEIGFDPVTGKSVGAGRVSLNIKKEKMNAILGIKGNDFNGKILKVSDKGTRIWAKLESDGTSFQGNSGSNCVSRQDSYKCIVVSSSSGSNIPLEDLSNFGEVINSKIHVKSRSGYRHKEEKAFETEILHIIGTLLNGKTLKVGPCCDGAFSQGSSGSNFASIGSSGSDCLSQLDRYICIVKNIPPDTSNEALKEAFSVYGEVIDVKIDFEYDTGKWVGSVSFGLNDEIDNAIRWMDGMVFNGNIIEVYEKDAPRQDYYKCVVSNIPRMTSEEALKDAFSKFGRVIKAKIHLDSRTRNSIQTGYVAFKEKKAMEYAIRHVNGMLFQGGILKVGPPCEGKSGSDCASFQESDCLSQQAGYVCIVYNIPPETTNEVLKEVFTPFGDVIYAEIDFDRVGSVSFRSKRDRADAILWMHGVFFKRHVLEVYEEGVPRNDYYKCTVSNFPLQTTKEELEKAFSYFGKVFHAKINVDSRTGESMQTGYVTFEKKEEMENAILHMNGRLFKGEILEVSPRGDGSSGSDHQCEGLSVLKGDEQCSSGHAGTELGGSADPPWSELLKGLSLHPLKDCPSTCGMKEAAVCL